MAERTFGWIQEAYTIENLKKVVSIFVLDSHINKSLRKDKIPKFISEEYGRDIFIEELGKVPIVIPYSHLKGRGTPKGYTRSNAPCSGIVQAALPGQKKGYQSDWPADSFLRWGISIGFLKYSRTDDMCSISELGMAYAVSEDGSAEEKEILTKAFMSYPPVCRILSLLDENGHMTKFEIGAQLGFIGEAGFTSIPQHMIIQGLSEMKTTQERTKLLRDTEGTSDKYVRTICSWLKQMGWVNQIGKKVSVISGHSKYTDTIGQAYQLTLLGKTVLKYSTGTSKFKRIPKRVMWDMLATKVSDRDYLRNRRTYIIQYLQSTYRTMQEILDFLDTKGIQESKEVIQDDIKGFINIGLHVKQQGNSYRIMDDIVDLEIPQDKKTQKIEKSNISVVKDAIRRYLVHVNHKYLVLLDLGFDGTSDRDYEIQTADLFTAELQFKGARLGDARKPDVCVFYDNKGLIIDNKAYSKGYSLPIKQADEMYRYIEENKLRDKKLNPNEWWKIFDSTVEEYYFAFVSGSFTGGFKDRIQNIHMRSGINGAAINSVNLLILAEELKAGRLSYEEGFKLFDCNDEIAFGV